jgi:hypothetical protein
MYADSDRETPAEMPGFCFHLLEPSRRSPVAVVLRLLEQDDD